MNNNKIILTGGSGRFAKVLKETNNKLKIDYPTKRQLDITSFSSTLKYIKKNKPKYFIHCAGLSRPMDIHDKDISRSINLNIIGTANIVRACSEFNIKLIYFSSGYVYPGTIGNYKENSPLLPINNYAWSKLGGEASVIMYKNSLILRLIMCEKPFVHKFAFSDIETNFIFHDEVAKMLPKLLNENGIINVGGKIQTVYNFAKKSSHNIKKISGRKFFPLKPSMNISKLKKILKKI